MNAWINACNISLNCHQLADVYSIVLEHRTWKISKACCSHTLTMYIPTYYCRDAVFADPRTLISQNTLDRELEQAVRFLHDNGTMLHYEDPVLSDLYFVDPQWLCDMLAHIVTVREINPLVRDGMRCIIIIKRIISIQL